jgi:homoserine O-acetyltransferase
MSVIQYFNHQKPFKLESGVVLPGFSLAYHTYGNMNRDASNVVWVFHALTANSNMLDWWQSLFADDSPIHPDEYFLICVNMPGSCYGSTGPLSINPESTQPWYHSFPLITIQDMVGMYEILRLSLGIEQIYLGVGGSMGGMQALQWAVLQPQLFQHLYLIATNAQHSAWGIAFNAAQRMAIEADSSWKEANELAGYKGLRTARAIAMISYRNYHPFKESQSDKVAKYTDFKAESYIKYQGEKLAQRFNAFSYVALSRSMDAHHVGRGYASTMEALARIRSKTMVTGIESDILFPVEEQLQLAHGIKQATFKLIDSPFGHDGFLIETEQLKEQLKELLNTQNKFALAT